MAGNYFSSDTIAAVATSLAGDAGVGIIRISGPKALAAAQAILRGFETPEPRFLHRVEVVSSTDTIDDGLAVYFPEKHSFTGEEVVELQLHGGRFLLQSILKMLLERGQCRMALPGEFSFRAVRNGKLTLAGAQAVGQVIGAHSMFEVQAARRSLGKNRYERFDRLAERIRKLLAQSELSIDFSDQDVEVISKENLAGELGRLLSDIEALEATLRSAQRLAKGVQVTLAGAPNAGKSTLFNAILAEERAIVSPVAGTTRDVITEEISVPPYYVRLADTAGLRASVDAIEREGVERAQGLAGESDLVLLVLDGTSFTPDDLWGWDTERTLVALNKADLVGGSKLRVAEEAVKAKGYRVASVAAAKGEGIDQLLSLIKRELDGRFGLALNSFLPTEFQLQMLVECKSRLGEAKDLVGKTGLSHPELLSSNLASAVKALSDLVGETTPDTVLAKIFSEFCIGK